MLEDVFFLFSFFFFKQKTAYEMRISDWSSDVCSSDLLPALNGAIMETMRLYPIAVAQIRTANKDFVFGGHLIQGGEMIYLGTAVPHFQSEFYPEIGRASCRERVCQYV